MESSVARKGAGRVDTDPWMTINAAADVIGVHRQTVKGMALEGTLRKRRFAGKVFVSRADVERVAKERQEAGR